jgi:hypothetical protein
MMALFDILILSAIGVLFALIWFVLVRASVRGGCGTSSCRLVQREAHKNERERNDG